MSFEPGTRVVYEVRHNPYTGSGPVVAGHPATVLEDRGRRVLIEYVHWRDGRTVRSAVRPHRISPA